MDNGPREGLDKFLNAASDSPETVLHYEFMQDYKVHLKHLDGRIEEVKNILYFRLSMVSQTKSFIQFQILTWTGSLFLSTSKWFSWRYCSILLQVIYFLFYFILRVMSLVRFQFLIRSFILCRINLSESLFYSCFDYTNALAVSLFFLDYVIFSC